MPKPPTFSTLYDEVKRISISSLKRWGYLESYGYKSGIVTWSRGDTPTGSIKIAVNLLEATPYVELSYSINGNPVNYRVPLVQVPSNLGKGSVWYFLCPQTERRCRILYLVGARFLHREAVKGAMYERQTYSKNWRGFKKMLDIVFGFDETLSQKHFRTHYNGQPTKRFKRLLYKHERNSQITENDLRQLLR